MWTLNVCDIYSAQHRVERSLFLLWRLVEIFDSEMDEFFNKIMCCCFNMQIYDIVCEPLCIL